MKILSLNNKYLTVVIFCEARPKSVYLAAGDNRLSFYVCITLDAVH